MVCRSLIGHGVTASLAVVLLANPAAVAGQQVEGSFQRTLTVGAQPDIEVVTGSGRIEVRPGPDGRVEIAARVRATDRWTFAGRAGAEERVRRIEADPPIEQSGDRIRIGHITDESLRRGISISFTLTVPAGSAIRARTGSGSQHIEGVTGAVDADAGSGSLTFTRLGGPLRASTGSGGITASGVGGTLHASAGSGSIRASDVNGAISARTGSGSIEVEQTGGGDVEVSSGSGSVRLRGIRGAVRASTASGGLAIQGELSGDWRLSASSGSIAVSLPAAQGFELDANSSSGRIEVGVPVTVTGRVDRRTLRGSVHGGGPLLHVRTSSGGIRIN